MRPFLRKHIFLSSFSRSSARTLLVGLHACEFSSSSQHCRPQAEEESRNPRVSVWWDLKNCSVPSGIDPLHIAPAITNAVRANGIRGPLHITAFCDVNKLSKPDQEALAFSGIRLFPGGKNSVNILIDLMCWVYENPPPAHLFLISGDRDFSVLLHWLRMNNYNILLCSPGNAPGVLCSAATIMWQWSSLLKGENLLGKRLNHPPGGQFDSWYGNFKVPLENPSSAAEQSPSLRNVEINEPSVDVKLGAVPKSAVQLVKHILSLHPKGISIANLKAVLRKCDGTLDQSFFGFRKFSHFLLSIPHVQLRPLEDGGFCACLVPSESPEAFESSVVASTTSDIKNEERQDAAILKLNGEDKNKARDADEVPSIVPFHERSMDDSAKSFQPVSPQGKTTGEYVDVKASFPSLPERHDFKPQIELQKSSLASEEVADVANALLPEIQLPFKDNKVSKTKMDSLTMRSKKSSDNDILKSENVSHEIVEKYTASGNHSAENDNATVENIDIANYESGNLKEKNKYENPTREEIDEVYCSSYTSPVDDSLVDRRPVGIAETYSKSPTFLSQIRSWWQSWKNNAKSDNSAAHQNKVVIHLEDSKSSELDQTVSHFEEPKLSGLDQNVNCSGKPELFSSGSFWSDMESFIFTPKGSLLVSQSKNREDMTHKLQNDGPPILRSLSENEIFQLVEFLIVEKKWLVESPSKTFPFRLTQLVQKKNSLMGLSHSANGLRSLFLSKATSQSNLQKSSEHHVEKHNQNIPHSRVSGTVAEMKCTERSRNDILEDCQKLVSDILREHPEGYNICSLRRHFFDRYNYHLDIQKLGYQKLTSLLQIMPGVKLQSNWILPSDGETSIPKEITNASHAVSNSDSELSDSVPKYNNLESAWEELGPVSGKNLNQSGLESKLSEKIKEMDPSKHPDYEPIMSYDSSDSEEDCSYLSQPEKQRKSQCNEQDSSLWQVLDLWDSGSKCSSGNHRQKSQKKYSFVVDSNLPDKDRVVDEILNTVNKAEELKMQN